MSALKRGDSGAAVSHLQSQLQHAVAPNLSVDGQFGASTEQALRTYQQRAGLTVDGMAGAQTAAALDAFSSRPPLSGSAWQAAAQRLNVELAALKAVAEVESLGSGFLLNGLPKILFERHVMYQRLSLPRSPTEDAQVLHGKAERLAADYPQLVNRQSGGYQGGLAEHQRLALARQLDARCANEATSWGAFQIMGYHWQRLGYASVNAFVEAMAADSEQQLAAFIRFIETDAPLHSALREQDWPQFARRYNGPAYARNQYDSKLASAYQRLRSNPVNV
ncbi:N-acetylmuramidase family protein [Pseudomonas sp. 5P_3.1_Bac2]|uniref:N-acetylmuramidase family protein n=1 Tax=Pseudomonas sp. 5P_3.1_Bac2 TaxID=2971617 RepID=UPI0021CA97A7|nr:N-acetylmuramidase family protein [Pseudomonas sp. 5P_3.1_Bac2]MCU1717422.1 N-acetylmuramidase family protein [Pseudomonas sp. 5P_3.1_Bac2]